jgi:hypothetical protein
VTALDVMHPEAEKEPRGVNHVIPLDVGSYIAQGFPVASNAHYHMPMAFPGTVPLHYVMRQDGFY